MRIPQWFVFVWVMFALVGAVAGGIFAYGEARNRTRELNEIGVVQSEEDFDPVRVVKLMTRLEEPQAPSSDDDDSSPERLVSEVERTRNAQLTPQASPHDATPVPLDASGIVETPAATEASIETPAVVETEAVAQAEYQAWNDPRRVTILLLGIDQRQGEQGPFPTDTIILLSLDPIAKSGVILSIPRDLWVALPSGLGENKINTANLIGEARQYPGGGGPALAMATVEALLGIRIDYYMMVNFDAFLTFVSTIGDVEVCPPEPIDDPKYPDGSYGFKPIYFDAGCQALNAERLLEYSRTRATSRGDFDRASRQQEVMLAIREKVLTTGGATALVRNATTIWESVKDNVRTDLSLQDLIELALLAETIPAENIRNGAIGPGQVTTGVSPLGEDILIPISTEILALVRDLFRAG